MVKTKNLYRLPFSRNVKTKAESDKSVFSHRGHMKHSLDFYMKVGTQILAAADGKVTLVKDDSNEGGMEKKYRNNILKWMNRIEIKHANREYSGYYHLKHKGVFVKKGQIVKKGQLIGLSGGTGWCDKPHLHFMVWKNFNRTPRLETLEIRFENKNRDC